MHCLPGLAIAGSKWPYSDLSWPLQLPSELPEQWMNNVWVKDQGQREWNLAAL